MLRKKKIISGKRIAPGLIEIDVPGKSKLIQGQKVLIYKTTTQNIIGSSGKVIGKKERVLGVGQVAMVGNKVVVKTPNAVDSTRALKIKKSAYTEPSTIYRTSKQKLRMSFSQADTSVLVKPVEE